MKKKLLTITELNNEYRKIIAKGKDQMINCGGNLNLAVSHTGLATYYVRINIKGKSTKKRIGSFGEISLGQARKKVVQELGQISKEQPNSANRENNSISVIETPLFGEYYQKWLSFFKCIPNQDNAHKNDCRFMNLRCYGKHLQGLNEVRLDQITPTLVDDVLSNTDTTQGNKRRAIRALNQCLKSAVVDGIIKFNPCINMLNSSGLISQKYRKPPVKGYAWVPAEELGNKFFNKLTNAPLINKYFYLILTLTGLRVGSLCNLKWEWINFNNKTITIPPTFMKMSKEFIVPITPMINILLKNWQNLCLENQKESEFVFYSKSTTKKKVRDVQMQEFVTSCLNGEVTMHGLRKSFRTWMAEIRVPEEVAETCLSHEHKSQIVQVYNKYNYLKERHSVLEIWNFFIYQLLPKEYIDLFGTIDKEYLNKCKSIYEKAKHEALKFSVV